MTEQPQRWAKLSFPEKIRWVEEAQTLSNLCIGTAAAGGGERGAVK